MKTKNIIVTIAFVLLILGLKAQTQYEYASVVYFNRGSMAKGVIATSYAGKYTETEPKAIEGSLADNLAPLLEVINQMSIEGWEVYANNINIPGGANTHVYYFLRKKKS